MNRRLLTIADMIEENSFVADIGSDHALLGLYLAKNKNCFIRCVENKKGPYMRTLMAIQSANLEEKMDVILSDGVTPIGLEVDYVVLAGLSAGTICDILKENKPFKNIIIAPSKDCPLARERLSKVYDIVDEKVICEKGTWYQIIHFKGSATKVLSELEIEFGPINLAKKDPLFITYLKQKHQQLTKIYHSSKCRAKNILFQITQIEEVL